MAFKPQKLINSVDYFVIPNYNTEPTEQQHPGKTDDNVNKDESTKLSPIKEEEIEDDTNGYSEWQSQRLRPSKEILKFTNDVIYIPQKITQTYCVNNKLFEKCIESYHHLYYYLRYQSRMQVVDGLYKVFTCTQSDEELVIFNAELHENDTESELFIIGFLNDKKYSMRWQMVAFMTAHQIAETFNINSNDLPFGSRCRWSLYPEIKSRIESEIQRFCLNTDKMNKLINIEQIKSGQKPNRPLFITRSQLFECIKASIHHNGLMSTIWFNKDKEHPIYRIQMLLPIEIEHHWFGISFDYDNKHQLIPVKICIDDVDIRRKLSLFNPSEQYNWFSNEITEINIINEQIQSVFFLQNQEISQLKTAVYHLMQQNREKDAAIKRLKQCDKVLNEEKKMQ